MKTDVTTIFYIIKLSVYKQKDWSQVIRAVGYNSLTLSFLHVERTCMTALFYQEGGVWNPKTSLTPPHFIEMPVTSQDSERSCICVLWVSILPLSVIFLLGLVLFR
jgi:hypothetical protein